MFNYFALLIGLSSFIVLDYYRVTAKLVDFFCCVPGGICCCLVKESDAADEAKPKEVITEERSLFFKMTNHFRQYSSPLTALVVDFYSPFLQSYIVKAVIIGIFTIWFGVTVWGCTTVEDGLDLDDILPEGTVEHSFASATADHFAAYGFIVATKDINYPDREVQRSLLQMSEEVGRARFVALAGGLTSNWLQLMIDYYASLQRFYEEEYCTQLPEILMDPIESRRYGDIVLVMSYIHQATDLSQNYTVVLLQVSTCSPALPSLVEVEGETNFTYINSENFYTYVALWVSKYK